MGKSEFPNGVGTASQSPKSGSATTKSASPSIKNHLFAEKLVPVLIDLFLSAPRVEEYNIFPEIIQGLGRCMPTRRDNPDGALWRLSVEGFNRILVDDVSRISVDGLQDPIITRPSRTRLWKEVADVYEIFLVGSCGRALPSKVMSSATLKADESLEMTILDVLGDNILSKQSDAPDDILLRLISTLDRCASRTCCLPVETVELMPSHCSKFSLTCLQKLFLLCRYSNQANVWSAARSRVSRISISVVMNRCEFILNKFLIDEKNLGERLLPALRIEEIVYVLEELSHLIIHIETAFVLPLKPYLIEALPRIESYGSRAHLLVLFPSFCELVISREARVRELVQVPLKLISSELGIQKVSLA